MKRSEFFKNVLGLGIGTAMLPQLVETFSESPVFDKEEEEQDIGYPYNMKTSSDVDQVEGWHAVSGTRCWTGVDENLEWDKGIFTGFKL
jgi:hypothetical protein